MRLHHGCVTIKIHSKLGEFSMPEQRYRWKSKHIRQQLLVLNGQKAPTIVLKDATYLNARMKQWKKHIFGFTKIVLYTLAQRCLSTQTLLQRL